MRQLLLLALFAIGCGVKSTGYLGEHCNSAGDCNSPRLSCQHTFNGEWQCAVKSEPETGPPRRCSYESECFCVTCAERCGASGVKTCAYSDTSVWGAKPALCECKP